MHERTDMSADPTTSTTKRVRILVMMDPTGHWEAVGSASYSDAETRKQLDELYGDMGPPPWSYRWVEADIPVPVEQPDDAIAGEVQSA